MPTSRRFLLPLALVGAAVLHTGAATAAADGGPDRQHGGPSQARASGPAGALPRSAPWPASIALPGGFAPEGVTSSGTRLFAGSLTDGAIYQADARTGRGSVLVPGRPGRIAQGLKVAGRTLVVAGGRTGHAYLYDTRTGAEVADLTLTTGDSQVNDVDLAGDAAWFTDSRQPQLYRVSVKSRANRADAPKVTTLPITGALVHDADPATIESNGIAILPGGRAALVVQSRTARLFRVDLRTGVSTDVPLSGGDVANGDGLLLRGRTLYVVQNRLNRIAVVDLDRHATRGTVTGLITNPAFRVPTTITSVGRALYAVNARFGTPVTPTTEYDIVRVDPS